MPRSSTFRSFCNKLLTKLSVSWNWNSNQPSGTAGEVKADEVTVTNHRGNEISKTGDESNPAVHIERSGNDVVKKASELKIDEKAPGTSETEEKKEETATAQPNGANEEKKEENDTALKPSESKEKEDEAKTGEKRKAGEQVDANEKETPAQAGEAAKEEDEQDAKKQKTANGAANGAANENKKAAGRPKSNGEKTLPKKEKRVPAIGKSERKTRSQGAA
jgi:hypothetical protein